MLARQGREEEVAATGQQDGLTAGRQAIPGKARLDRVLAFAERGEGFVVEEVAARTGDGVLGPQRGRGIRGRSPLSR